MPDGIYKGDGWGEGNEASYELKQPFTVIWTQEPVKLIAKCFAHYCVQNCKCMFIVIECVFVQQRLSITYCASVALSLLLCSPKIDCSCSINEISTVLCI